MLIMIMKPQLRSMWEENIEDLVGGSSQTLWSTKGTEIFTSIVADQLYPLRWLAFDFTQSEVLTWMTR